MDSRGAKKLPSGAVSDAISAWHTRLAVGTSRGQIEAVAKAIVYAFNPPNVARARSLLHAAVSLAVWADSIGADLVPEVVLAPDFVDRFLLNEKASKASSSWNTLRTNLRALGQTTQPHLWPHPIARGARKPPPEPYSADVEARFLDLIDKQPELDLRERLLAVYCAIRGGGLSPGDLRSTRGRDVRLHSGAAVVAVANRGEVRQVPVMEPFGLRLLDIAARRPDEFVAGGDIETRKNITGQLFSRVRGGHDLPMLKASRLRATWMVERLEHTRLKSVLTATGMQQSSLIFDLMRFIPDPSLEQIIDDLGCRQEP